MFMMKDAERPGGGGGVRGRLSAPPRRATARNIPAPQRLGQWAGWEGGGLGAQVRGGCWCALWGGIRLILLNHKHHLIVLFLLQRLDCGVTAQLLT